MHTWTIAAQNYYDADSIVSGCIAAARGDKGDQVGAHLAALKVATAWECEGRDMLARDTLMALHAQICTFHHRQTAKNARALIAAAESFRDIA